MILLKLDRHDRTEVSLVVNAKVRVQELAVVWGEYIASWGSYRHLRETLITCGQAQKKNISVISKLVFGEQVERGEGELEDSLKYPKSSTERIAYVVLSLRW